MEERLSKFAASRNCQARSISLRLSEMDGRAAGPLGWDISEAFGSILRIEIQEMPNNYTRNPRTGTFSSLLSEYQMYNTWTDVQDFQ